MIFLRRVLWFLILIDGNFGIDFELSSLVEKIYNDGGSATVYFVGIDQEFVNEFSRSHVDIPVVIITSSAWEFGKPSNSSSAAVLIVKTSDMDREYDELLQRVIRILLVRKFIVLSARNLEALRYFCSYFVENKFSRIFGVVGNTTYAYLNFENEPIQKISRDQPLPNAWKNLNGFVLRTTIQKDIPRVFWYCDKSGKNVIGGCYGRLLVNFLSHHNATFREVFPNSTSQFSMSTIIKALGEKKIDISMNVWGPWKGFQLTYTVRIQSYTIMVPLNGYLDPNQYFVRPFSLGVWLLIGFTVVYIICMNLITNLICQSTLQAWNCISRTILIILNWTYSGPYTDYRFHVQIILLAFVLGNIYNVYCTSFLTAFIQIKQYNTKQDLVYHKVPVMIPVFEWPVIQSTQLTEMGFDNIVHPVEYPVYTENTNNQNPKFAYAIGADRAKFLIGLQKLFAKPLFHTTQDELYTSHLGYLMVPYSPFKEILDDFIHRINELGFMAKWEADSVPQALRAGFRIKIDRQAGVMNSHNPLTLNHLQFAWNCLMIGLITSFVVFLLEKLIKNLTQYFKNNKK